MKFKSKKSEIQTENKKNEDIEIIMGDASDLEISSVGDCVNKLNPKKHKSTKQNLVIPKTKKSKD